MEGFALPPGESGASRSSILRPEVTETVRPTEADSTAWDHPNDDCPDTVVASLVLALPKPSPKGSATLELKEVSNFGSSLRESKVRRQVTGKQSMPALLEDIQHFLRNSLEEVKEGTGYWPLDCSPDDQAIALIVKGSPELLAEIGGQLEHVASNVEALARDPACNTLCPEVQSRPRSVPKTASCHCFNTVVASAVLARHKLPHEYFPTLEMRRKSSCGCSIIEPDIGRFVKGRESMSELLAGLEKSLSANQAEAGERPISWPQECGADDQAIGLIVRGSPPLLDHIAPQLERVAENTFNLALGKPS
jgi:hypothetical protein